MGTSGCILVASGSIGMARSMNKGRGELERRFMGTTMKKRKEKKQEFTREDRKDVDGQVSQF